MMLRSGRAVVSSAPAQRFAECVAALRACANRFGGEAAARKAALLRDCAGCALTEPDSLLAYHDCLLFLLAYPRVGHAACRRPPRTEARRRSHPGHDRIGSCSHTSSDFANSGVAWAPMTIAFGYDVARWLAERHPHHAEIDSFDAGGASLPALLRHALPALEFEMLAADDAASGDLLAAASEGHRGTRLQWLVAQCDRLPCSEQLREQLFDALKAFITIDPGAGTLSRTFVRSLPGRTYFHRGDLLRRVDRPALVALPLAPPPALSRAQREHLLDAGRAMLASLGRETDAISAAEPAGIEHHALGRGVTITLYAMAPGRRLPLDSHVGFMLFKNSIPVGYGGGWPFLTTAKIGVNIFPPFRGGESALLFCQVLTSTTSASGSTVSSPSHRSSAAATAKDSNPAPSGSITGWDSGRLP